MNKRQSKTHAAADLSNLSSLCKLRFGLAAQSVSKPATHAKKSPAPFINSLGAKTSTYPPETTSTFSVTLGVAQDMAAKIGKSTESAARSATQEGSEGQKGPKKIKSRRPDQKGKRARVMSRTRQALEKMKKTHMGINDVSQNCPRNWKSTQKKPQNLPLGDSEYGSEELMSGKSRSTQNWLLAHATPLIDISSLSLQHLARNQVKFAQTSGSGTDQNSTFSTGTIKANADFGKRDRFNRRLFMLKSSASTFFTKVPKWPQKVCAAAKDGNSWRSFLPDKHLTYPQDWATFIPETITPAYDSNWPLDFQPADVYIVEDHLRKFSSINLQNVELGETGYASPSSKKSSDSKSPKSEIQKVEKNEPPFFVSENEIRESSLNGMAHEIKENPVPLICSEKVLSESVSKSQDFHDVFSPQFHANDKLLTNEWASNNSFEDFNSIERPKTSTSTFELKKFTLKSGHNTNRTSHQDRPWSQKTIRSLRSFALLEVFKEVGETLAVGSEDTSPKENDICPEILSKEASPEFKNPHECSVSPTKPQEDLAPGFPSLNISSRIASRDNNKKTFLDSPSVNPKKACSSVNLLKSKDLLVSEKLNKPQALPSLTSRSTGQDNPEKSPRELFSKHLEKQSSDNIHDLSASEKSISKVGPEETEHPKSFTYTGKRSEAGLRTGLQESLAAAFRSRKTSKTRMESTRMYQTLAKDIYQHQKYNQKTVDHGNGFELKRAFFENNGSDVDQPPFQAKSSKPQMTSTFWSTKKPQSVESSLCPTKPYKTISHNRGASKQASSVICRRKIMSPEVTGSTPQSCFEDVGQKTNSNNISEQPVASFSRRHSETMMLDTDFKEENVSVVKSAAEKQPIKPQMISLWQNIFPASLEGVDPEEGQKDLTFVLEAKQVFPRFNDFENLSYSDKSEKDKTSQSLEGLKQTLEMHLDEGKRGYIEGELWAMIDECKAAGLGTRETTDQKKLDIILKQYSKCFRTITDHFADSSKRQLINYASWLSELRKCVCEAFDIVCANGKTAFEIIKLMMRQPASIIKLSQVQSDITLLLNSLTGAYMILGKVRDDILQAKKDMPQYVKAILSTAQIAQISWMEIQDAYDDCCTSSLCKIFDEVTLYEKSGCNDLRSSIEWWTLRKSTDYEELFSKTLVDLQEAHSIASSCRERLDKLTKEILEGAVDLRNGVSL